MAPKYPGLPSETPATLVPSTTGFDHERRDVMIAMRDGVRLHTVILVPKGAKGAPMLLLHTTGARSGRKRVNPLMYQDLGGGRVAVFASKGGADTHPDWYRNLVANPDVSAEIGTETRRFRSRTAPAAERERIWTKQKREHPGFADYETKTAREIPVVILEPVPSS